jgi:hypothetical protein
MSFIKMHLIAKASPLHRAWPLRTLELPPSPNTSIGEAKQYFEKNSFFVDVRPNGRPGIGAVFSLMMISGAALTARLTAPPIAIEELLALTAQRLYVDR